ncbi:MAG: FAD-dependent oxidoreductase [Streptosporangiaceae bacterium]|nr:FAD-dependent oxidoreductase [Streptosporangiaceae bacterium]MBV9856119.1 FAD-dependent oxidoreductase [Streptosporangiaceae bacterium]
MTRGDLDALVIGAGVCGLTTAISLAEAGLRTRIRTANLPGQTTSVAAGAVWGPVMSGSGGRVREWARTGLEVLTALETEPAAGVRAVTGKEVSRVPADPPVWTDLLPGIRLCGLSELPEGFVAGWHYTAPVVTMPVYLGYLRARFEQAGGQIEVAPVDSLAAMDAPLVVNCTGTGARDLVPDPSVVPVRGQVVLVANPGIEEFYIDHSQGPPDYVYFFPHGDILLLGGTAEEGAWDMAPRPAAAKRILADCAAADPRLRDARVLGHRVGLRPYRPEVRLEAERLPDGRVLWHNYGHGGAGVTLSWGCAREITEAVLAEAPRYPRIVLRGDVVDRCPPVRHAVSGPAAGADGQGELGRPAVGVLDVLAGEVDLAAEE